MPEISRFYGIVIKCSMKQEANIINHMSMLSMESMRHQLALMARF